MPVLKLTGCLVPTSGLSETTIVRTIVQRALEQGFICQVDNGDGWETPEQSINAITEELTGVGESTLYIGKIETMIGPMNKPFSVQRGGSILFVFGNSPEELVADYSDNEYVTGVLKEFA